MQRIPSHVPPGAGGGKIRAIFSRRFWRPLAIAALLLPLGACMSLDNWSEPGGYYDYGDGYGNAPGWYGRDVASVDIFYGSLSRWGSWGMDPYYGRVWRPSGIGAGWRPYMLGHWVNEPHGRRWISSEPFGWATYHYGRWGQNRNGWFWVPGQNYGPGWVQWADRGSQVGWAPMPPSGWQRHGMRRGNDWWLQAPRGNIWRPSLAQELARRHNYAWRPSGVRPAQTRPNVRPSPTRPPQARPDGREQQQLRARPPRGGEIRARSSRPDGAIARPDRSRRPEGVVNRADRPRQIRPGQNRPRDARQREARPGEAHLRETRPSRRAPATREQRARPQVARPQENRANWRASQQARPRAARPTVRSGGPDMRAAQPHSPRAPRDRRH